MAASWLSKSGTIAVERVRLLSLVVTGGATNYGHLKVLDGRDDEADTVVEIISAPNASQQYMFAVPVVLNNGMRVTLDGNLAGVMVIYDYE